MRREKKRAQRGRRRATPAQNRSRRTLASGQTSPPSIHPSMQYNHPYTTAELIFGKGMTAAELIARVRTYDWKEAFIRVALLAGLVANSPDGAFADAVLRRTVDQIPR